MSAARPLGRDPLTAGPGRTPPGGWTRRSFMAAAATAGVGAALLPYGRGLTAAQAQAQELPLGVSFDPAPFMLGVASGDPTADSVVLQTRLTDRPFDLDRPSGDIPDQVEVGWVVATDPRLRRVVARGTAQADVATGHSVHVDVTGLEPGRHHWYRFTALGRASRVGRTKTAGVAPLQRLRAAWVSCQSFPHGYFTAYQNLCREDVDVVFHLGDYMYEYGTGGYGDFRASPPDAEVFSLNSYRVRYAAYRGDPWLRQAHALFPFVVTWDDHEVDNNWASDTPENTTDPGNRTPQEWDQRRFNAFQAYHENMPIRPAPEQNDPAAPQYEIYRQAVFGDLLDVSILDTRQHRTDQPCDDGFIVVACGEQSSEDATILGATQRDWLFGNLSTSTTAWRMVAQQLVVSETRTTSVPQLLPPGTLPDLPEPLPTPGGPTYFSADAWDGYKADQRALVEHLATGGIPDTFIITGDIHSHWVFDVKEDFGNPLSPTVATEFVGTSVTSPGFEALPTGNAVVREVLYANNPHLGWFEGTRKGYAILDITPDRVRTTYRVVDAIDTPTSGVSTLAAFELPRGGTAAQVEGGDANPLRLG